MYENKSVIVNDLSNELLILFANYVKSHIDYGIPQENSSGNIYQVFKSYTTELADERYVTPFVRRLFEAIYHLTHDINMEDLESNIREEVKNEVMYYQRLSLATD